MNSIRTAYLCAALGGLTVLGGCVAVPAGAVYGNDVYSQPYYADPTPITVLPPSVYIEGGSYYERPYWPYYRNPAPFYGRPPLPVAPLPGVQTPPGRFPGQAGVPRPPRGGVPFPQPGVPHAAPPGVNPSGPFRGVTPFPMEAPTGGQIYPPPQGRRPPPSDNRP